jgi:hypothetical protein
MAYEESLKSVSFEANADLSSHQYKFVQLNSSRKLILNVTDGAMCIGVLQDKPAASGRVGAVAVEGVTKVVANGIIAVGAPVSSTNAGLAQTAGTGDVILGTAVTASSGANQVISVLLEARGTFA